MGIMEMMMAIKDMQGVCRVLACFFKIQGLQALHISFGIVHWLHQALLWAFRLLRKGLLVILTCVWIFKKQFIVIADYLCHQINVMAFLGSKTSWPL